MSGWAVKCLWPSPRSSGFPPPTQGIDLVAETREGEFWAIQCKYRQDTDHSLTWREISTFTGLAFGVCRGFTFGIICSTTERITHVLKEQERIGFCALDVWQALDADFFKRLRAHLARKAVPLKPLKPRPHQKAAIKDAHQHFVVQRAKRGKLIMPCGSGKSLTAWWIAEKFGSQGRQRKGGGSVQFDIDERIDLADFAREIELKCWDRLAKLSWRPFEEAREFVRGLRLHCYKDWMCYCAGGYSSLGKLPPDREYRSLQEG